MLLTPAQCRAARALLDWPREQLAGTAKVAMRTIADFEASRRDPINSTLAALRAALEAAGVEFIPQNGGGPGVRLKQGSVGHVMQGVSSEAGDTTAREMADHQVSKALKGVDASPSEKAERRDRLTKPPKRQDPPIDEGKSPEDLDASNDD